MLAGKRALEGSKIKLETKTQCQGKAKAWIKSTDFLFFLKDILLKG